jgi:hypothetical protein
MPPLPHSHADHASIVERWVCTFRSRAGSEARATFASHAQARVFAELHAQAGGGPLAWTRDADGWLLRTATGTYRLARVSSALA